MQRFQFVCFWFSFSLLQKKTCSFWSFLLLSSFFLLRRILQFRYLIKNTNITKWTTKKRIAPDNPKDISKWTLSSSAAMFVCTNVCRRVLVSCKLCNMTFIILRNIELFIPNSKPPPAATAVTLNNNDIWNLSLIWEMNFYFFYRIQLILSKFALNEHEISRKGYTWNNDACGYILWIQLIKKINKICISKKRRKKNVKLHSQFESKTRFVKRVSHSFFLGSAPFPFFAWSFFLMAKRKKIVTWLCKLPKRSFPMSIPLWEEKQIWYSSSTDNPKSIENCLNPTKNNGQWWYAIWFRLSVALRQIPLSLQR